MSCLKYDTFLLRSDSKRKDFKLKKRHILWKYLLIKFRSTFENMKIFMK